METLKEKTARGLFWGGMSNLVMQLIGMVCGFVVARLLDNADYGMMAAIVVFTTIATELKDSGFKTALANESHPEGRDYNAVFWFNLLMGLGLYAILFLSAPLLGRYYHNEAVVPLARYAFSAVVITAFSTSQSAWLFKNLRTKQLAKASMAATLVSGMTGVVMAALGGSYWALVTQSLVYVSVNTLLLWHYSPWRPVLEWDFEPVRRMFGFSWKVMVTTIATQINNNIVNVLAVRHFGQQRAGNYFQAYQWDSKAFSLVQGMVGQVAQPVLVDLREDGDRQLNALRKLMRFTAFIAFPLLLGLRLVSHEFIVLSIGAKWLPSVPLLRMLCVSGAVMPLCTLLSNSILSKGRSDLYLWSTLLFCLMQIAMMTFLWPRGLTVMVVAYVALNLAWLFVWYALTARLTGYHLQDFLRDTVPFALSALAVMTVTGWLTQRLSAPWLLLLVRIIMATLLYYAVMRIAGANILQECIMFLKRRSPTSSPPMSRKDAFMA